MTEVLEWKCDFLTKHCIVEYKRTNLFLNLKIWTTMDNNNNKKLTFAR